MAVSFKGTHFPKDILLTGVHWYIAYPPPVDGRHTLSLFAW